MAVRKQCRAKGCKSSPRCDHPWWFDTMHQGKRYRMPVDAFALLRGAQQPVTSKQEAEKIWEPKFIGEIVAGRDPRKKPAPLAQAGLTVFDFLDSYYERYVVAESLQSAASIRSRLGALKVALGALPISELERVDPIEDFKRKRCGESKIDGLRQPNARDLAACDQLGTWSDATDLHLVAVPQVWRQDQNQGRDETRSPSHARRGEEPAGRRRRDQLRRTRLRRRPDARSNHRRARDRLPAW